MREAVRDLRAQDSARLSVGAMRLPDPAQNFKIAR
jgi:hypothetical protein